MNISELKFKKQEDVIEYTKEKMSRFTDIKVNEIKPEKFIVSLEKSNLRIHSSIKMNKDGFAPIEFFISPLIRSFNTFGPNDTSVPERLYVGDFNEEELEQIWAVMNDVLEHWSHISKKKRKEPFFVVRLDDVDFMRVSIREKMEKMVQNIMKGTNLEKVEEGKNKVDMYLRYHLPERPAEHDEDFISAVIGIYVFPKSLAFDFFEQNMGFLQELEKVREVYPELFIRDLSASRERFSNGHVINEYLNVRGKLIFAEIYTKRYELELDAEKKQIKINEYHNWEMKSVGTLKVGELKKFFTQVELNERHNHLFSQTVKKGNFEMLLQSVIDHYYECDLNVQFEKLSELVELPIEAERISAQFLRLLEADREKVILCDVGKFVLYEFVINSVNWYLVVDLHKQELTFFIGEREEAKKILLEKLKQYVEIGK